MILLIQGTYRSQSHGDKVERWLPVAGVGGWESVFSGYGVSLWDNQKLWKQEMVMVANIVNVLNATKLDT